MIPSVDVHHLLPDEDSPSHEIPLIEDSGLMRNMYPDDQRKSCLAVRVNWISRRVGNLAEAGICWSCHLPMWIPLYSTTIIICGKCADCYFESISVYRRVVKQEVGKSLILINPYYKHLIEVDGRNVKGSE